MSYKSPDDILSIKCLRLEYPSLNDKYTPLSGVYDPVDSINKDDIFNNKFTDFALTSNIPITSALLLSNNFGKVFFGDHFKALIILYNKTDKAIMLKKLAINISKDSNYKNIKKNQKFFDKIELKPNKIYSVYAEKLINEMTKNLLIISCDIEYYEGVPVTTAPVAAVPVV